MFTGTMHRYSDEFPLLPDGMVGIVCPTPMTEIVCSNPSPSLLTARPVSEVNRKLLIHTTNTQRNTVHFPSNPESASCILYIQLFNITRFPDTMTNTNTFNRRWGLSRWSWRQPGGHSQGINITRFPDTMTNTNTFNRRPGALSSNPNDRPQPPFRSNSLSQRHEDYHQIHNPAWL